MVRLLGYLPFENQAGKVVFKFPVVDIDEDILEFMNSHSTTAEIFRINTTELKALLSDFNFPPIDDYYNKADFNIAYSDNRYATLQESYPISNNNNIFGITPYRYADNSSSGWVGAYPVRNGVVDGYRLKHAQIPNDLTDSTDDEPVILDTFIFIRFSKYTQYFMPSAYHNGTVLWYRKDFEYPNFEQYGLVPDLVLDESPNIDNTGGGGSEGGGSEGGGSEGGGSDDDDNPGGSGGQPMSKITLYKNNSEPIVIGKSLTKIATINGNLRDSTDIVNPEITIKYSKVPDFNYLYYDELKRYYFVDSIESIVTNVWKLGLHVDVLETYKQDIWNCRGLVERNEFTYNPLLVDTAQAYESGYNIEVIDGNINIGGNITGIETPCYMIVGTQLSTGRALV